jgi:hypothetical protein
VLAVRDADAQPVAQYVARREGDHLREHGGLGRRLYPHAQLVAAHLVRVGGRVRIRVRVRVRGRGRVRVRVRVRVGVS